MDKECTPSLEGKATELKREILVKNEMFAMNEAINEHMKYCDTVAQLSTLATLQNHFVNLVKILNHQ